jgi:hypothetical protein
MTRNPTGQAARTKLDPAARALGARLREMFDAVASGPMPEHLVDLVDQLERAHEARQAETGLREPRSLAEVS